MSKELHTRERETRQQEKYEKKNKRKCHVRLKKERNVSVVD
jgi:hypothetical protein